MTVALVLQWLNINIKASFMPWTIPCILYLNQKIITRVSEIDWPSMANLKQFQVYMTCMATDL